MDELKNLMIQTLEANGILGQLRAQIRCSVFKIIDNQDEMEDPKLRGKSALHWENPAARAVLANQNGLLLAELIREYLEFYKLDYSKQIFMPETNLNTKQPTSGDDLAEKSGLDSKDVDRKKPLLLQILEKFQAGGGGTGFGGPNSKLSSPDVHPGVQFSEEKGSAQIQPLSIGEGILQPSKTPPKDDKIDKHVDKANSLLDEFSREDRSGFKAEFGLGGGSDKSLAKMNDSDKQKSKKSNKKSDKSDSNYEEEFEDIEEDLAGDRDDIEESVGLDGLKKIGESHGITVSQSLGIDPSVDSLALEDYDHIEPVERLPGQ